MQELPMPNFLITFHSSGKYSFHIFPLTEALCMFESTDFSETGDPQRAKTHGFPFSAGKKIIIFGLLKASEMLPNLIRGQLSLGSCMLPIPWVPNLWVFKFKLYIKVQMSSAGCPASCE